MPTQVQICNTGVRLDAEGRYSLNDLHRSAIANGKATESQKPSEFLRAESVKAFIAVLDAKAEIPALVVKKGGNAPGVYAAELVAIRYAAWIDPSFEVQVYQSFQESRHRQMEAAREEMVRAASRQQARLEAPFMTAALRDARAEQGKATASHHYRNEMDMLNRIVLGLPAKEYRQAYDVADDHPIREALSAAEIAAIEALQRFNSSLILLGMPFERRKEECVKLFNRRHAEAIEREALLALA